MNITVNVIVVCFSKLSDRFKLLFVVIDTINISFLLRSKSFILFLSDNAQTIRVSCMTKKDKE